VLKDLHWGTLGMTAAKMDHADVSWAILDGFG
jgi:hypothetical protein